MTGNLANINVAQDPCLINKFISKISVIGSSHLYICEVDRTENVKESSQMIGLYHDCRFVGGSRIAVVFLAN